MKVKVGDKIYDGNDERIMVILTEQDKQNIKNMSPEATMYCVYPEAFYKIDDIHKWMTE